MDLTARVRLRLLGRFALADGCEAANPVKISTRKAGALIAYLAVKPDQSASREELATLLWGKCPESQARQNLRQALATLRRELKNPDLLVTNNETIGLQPSLWSVDARAFDQLTKSTTPADLARAAHLFGGEFLADYPSLDEESFDEWLRGQRQLTQMAAFRLCATYAARPDLVQDGGAAIAAVEQLLAIDPLHEDCHRQALTLYARYRGRNEALAQAEAFAGILRRELDVAPEKETRALVERIRAGSIAPAEFAPDRVNARPPAAEGVPLAAVAKPEASDDAFDSGAAPLPARSIASGRQKIAAGLAIALAVGAGLWTATNGIATAVRNSAPLAPTGAVPPAGTWSSPPLPTRPSREPNKAIIPILVLPFETFGESGKSIELLADMITDDLINLLSRVSFTRVISRQTAMTYKGQAIDVAVIGAELQVKYILEGSMRMHGDKLRVNVELIDPATRLPVWTTRIERADADRQAVQDEIVGRLARELQFEIIPIESARRSKDQDADALAYRGWASLKHVGLKGYNQARSYFEQALERDPQNLSAEIGMGAYHARMGAQVLDSEPLVHRAKAQELLLDAIARDPQSSVAYFYLGLALDKLPTLTKAIDAFEHAIEIDPSNASAHGQIGNALIRTGRPAEGLEHVRYAMRLSPRDPILEVWIEFAGNGEMELGHYAEAIELFRRASAVNPGYPRTWAGLAAAHALAGHPAEAHTYAEKLRTFQPRLSTESLIEQFGRAEKSRLYQGLRMAFAQANAL